MVMGWLCSRRSGQSPPGMPDSRLLCAGSALDFARQRMAGVARSKEMLAPLTVAGVRVFAPASQFASS